MRLAIISPIKHLREFSTLGSMQFALAHIRDTDYVNFYKEQSKHSYTIIDNGAWELGRSIEFQDIIDAALNIGADEIVTPDVMWKPEESYQLTKKFLDYVDENGYRCRFNFMTPVWSHSLEDYPAMYEKYLSLGPDCIGLGKWLSLKYAARTWMVYKLQVKEIWDDSIDHHLLGSSYPGEAYEMYEEVRSMDTSGPVAHGRQLVRYEYGKHMVELHQEPPERKMPFETVLSDKEKSVAHWNCEVMLDFSRGRFSEE